MLNTIAASDSIRFIEGGKNGSTLTADSQLVWTNGGTDLPPGMLVQISLGAAPSNAATATGGGSITTQPTGWNLDSAGDSLFAVTGTVAAPGTYVAALVYGDTSVGTLSTGTSTLTLTTKAATRDVGSISGTVANTAYATAAAAKTAYVNTGSWVRDGATNDGTGTNNPEWPAFGDANSPLFGKTALNVAAPTVTFNDANGRIGAAEATASPVTIAGLAPGSTAVVTFKSSAGTPTVTASFTGNGQQNVNFSPLADGTISITQVVVTSGGTNSTLTSASTVLLDETSPTTTTTIRLVQDTGAAGDGITSNPALTGTFNNANVSTVTIFDGGTAIGTAAVTSNVWTFTPTGAAAANGTHSYTARATDFAGNYGPAGATTPASVTVDTTAPTAITSIGLVADTGTPGDGISSNPALTGTSSVATAGQIITIKDGATVIGTATTAAGGSWSFANTGATQTAHSYTAAVTDTAGNLGPAGATTPASVTVDTTADTNVAVDLTDATAGPTTASIAFDITNLDAGSTATVTFTGAGGGTASQAYTTNGEKTGNVSGLVDDITATVSVTDAAGNVAAGGGDTLAGDPVCFYPGTLVRTPAGDVAVEWLRIGDLVLTAEGRTAPIRWMGRQAVATRFADPLTTLPIRIRAGALAENLPERDLLVSPGHAILLQGLLVHAGALVNDTSIRRETAVPQVFTYHHVELVDHSLILAEGVPAETYVANVERLAFDNAAEHAALYGADAAIPEMDLPRAKSHRQVPMAVRRQIADRATALLGAIAA